MDISQYPKNVFNALLKRGLIGREGPRKPYVFRRTKIVRSKSGAQGPGPIIDEEALSKLIDADTTPEKEWFDWLLFQAGGGKEAYANSKTFYEAQCNRFVRTCMAGDTDPKTGEVHPPVSKEEAEARLKLKEKAYKLVNYCGNDDILDERNVFGYYRHWPGKNRIYETVTSSLKKFLALLPKIAQMNAYLRNYGQEDKLVGVTPEDYTRVSDMELACQRVTLFFGAAAARKDVRTETIYDDDMLRVICPLTHTAAVRYGWDSWKFSDTDAYEQSLSSSARSHLDPWAAVTSVSVVVLVNFKIAVPRWITLTDKAYKKNSIQNLAVPISHKDLKSFDPNNAEIMSEDTAKTTTLSEITKMIYDEARRDENAVDNENDPQSYYPIHRGAKVVTTEEEAANIVAHLTAAFNAIKTWAATFDTSKVKVDWRT